MSTQRRFRQWATFAVVLLAGLTFFDAVADARKRRRGKRRSRSTWVIPPGSATHALKPLEAIGMDRKRVSAVTTRLGLQLAAVPGVKLPRLKDVRRFLKSRNGATYAVCEGELDCVAKFGRLIKAPLVVAGDLSGLSKGYVLFLRLVDPRKRKVLRKISVVYGGKSNEEARVLKEAAYRLLAPDKFVGRLKLEVDVQGAAVYLNGKPLGKSPVAARQIQAGTHALRVTHPNFHDYMRFIRVHFEKDTVVKVSLKMYPIIAEEMTAKNRKRPGGVQPGQQVIYKKLPWYKQWWFVTSVGVAVLATTLTTVALVRQRHLDRDASVTLVKPLRSAPVLLRFR